MDVAGRLSSPLYEISNKWASPEAAVVRPDHWDVFEGVFTFICWQAEFQWPAGLLTGLLAFVPNIGRLFPDLMVASASRLTGEGLWAIFVFPGAERRRLSGGALVRAARSTAPALVLAAQLLFGVFGYWGCFGDLIVAIRYAGEIQ
jgi:hypothetical protein